MRVLLVSESFHPVYAGPAVRFRRYLPGLRERGIEVEVATATPKAQKRGMTIDSAALPSGRVGEWLPVETVDGVRVQRVQLPSGGSWRRGRMFSRRVLDLCSGSSSCPDVVQFLSLGLPWRSVLRELRRRHVPTVFTKTMVAEPPRSAMKRGVRRALLKEAFCHVDRVVVSSSVMKANLAMWGVERGVEVIPNGVDLRRFRPPESRDERDALRARLGIPSDSIVALFVGPISPRKGVDLALSSWAQVACAHPSLILLLVGPRRDETDLSLLPFRRRLDALVASSGAPDRVRFIGAVEEVQDYMRASDLFLFPSRREGMPNVIPEAMASGLPVIMTPFAGLPSEFGVPGKHYLLADFASDALAAAILELVGDAERRRELGVAGRRWTQAHMGVDRSLDKYAELYRGLARSPK